MVKVNMPLKRPYEDLSEEELEYYSRQIVLKEIGYNGQLKLKNAKVCVIGLGGLGSPVATQLTAMGVGHLRLVDRDVVEPSNLQRQHLYSMSYLGYPKVEAAAKKLSQLNPNVEIEPIPLSVNVDNAEEIIKGIDVIVDGLDRISPRYAVNRACVKLKVPYVFGAAVMTYGSASTIIPGETPCLECFYGNLDDEALPTCSVAGVHPSILSLMASIEVAEATKILLGERPQLINKLLHCDIEAMTFEEAQVSRVENCPVCGSKPNGTPTPLRRELIEEICGRGGKQTFIITPKKNLELNMEDLRGFLLKKGFNVNVSTEIGVTFNHGFTASLLKSGVMIIEGASNQEEAYDFYKEIVINDLGVSPLLIK